MKKYKFIILIILTVLFCALCFMVGCKELDASSFDLDEDHFHSFGDWVIVIDPTCTEDGLQERYCLCGEKQSSVLEPLGHNYVYNNLSDATCTSSGCQEHVNCSRCDYTIYTEIPALGHNFGEWQVVEVPTCTESGKEMRICLNDSSHMETREIPPIAHTESGWITGFQPTCEMEGYKYKLCNLCCEVLDTETIPALGHNYGEWVLTTAPTCSDEGIETRICSHSVLHTQTRTVDAFGHSFNRICVDDETHIEVCGICGEFGEVSPHEWEGGVCNICGFEKPEIDEPIVSNELSFELISENSYAVTGIGTVTQTEIEIPSTYKGLPVTAIAPYAFSGCSFITSITIPESIMVIGNDAFYGCESLAEVIFVNTGNWLLYENNEWKGTVFANYLENPEFNVKLLNTYRIYTWKRD